jgi:transglutaminase-like putative cysteine protease
VDAYQLAPAVEIAFSGRCFCGAVLLVEQKRNQQAVYRQGQYEPLSASKQVTAGLYFLSADSICFRAAGKRDFAGASVALWPKGFRLISLQIHHRTTYRYRQPVSLGPHRLMLRPRESRELRLLSTGLTTDPPASLTFAHDVFGNSVATAQFEAFAERLTIDCLTQLSLDADAWPVFDVAASAIVYPFSYSEDERTDLGALMFQQYADPTGRLRDWAWAFVRGTRTDTLALLKDLGAGVSGWIAYQSRDDEGVQSPVQTLDRGWGSCRDFAVLFVEAARCLGFGARIVSGYLCAAQPGVLGTGGAGSTHAWAEIYVPGAGWITFDPTNRSYGGANLIPVAVARDIRLAMPVTGSFTGVSDAFLGMDVEVEVTAVA